MKSAMNKIAVLVFSVLVFSSCSNTKEIAGNYKIDRNPITEVLLTLKHDKSFIEFVNTYGCTPTWYFGFYSQARGRIQLKQRSGDLSYLNKRDTQVYYKNNALKGKDIILLFNEQKPFDIAEVYANGNTYLGKADKNGYLRIPDSILLDSIRIESGIFENRHFVIREKDFSRLFIIVYDYTFVNCSDLTFNATSTLEITSQGLLFYPNWERKKAPNKVFLRKDND